MIPASFDGSGPRLMKDGGLDRGEPIEPVMEHLFQPLGIAHQGHGRDGRRPGTSMPVGVGLDHRDPVRQRRMRRISRPGVDGQQAKPDRLQERLREARPEGPKVQVKIRAVSPRSRDHGDPSISRKSGCTIATLMSVRKPPPARPSGDTRRSPIRSGLLPPGDRPDQRAGKPSAEPGPESKRTPGPALTRRRALRPGPASTIDGSEPADQVASPRARWASSWARIARSSAIVSTWSNGSPSNRALERRQATTPQQGRNANRISSGGRTPSLRATSATSSNRPGASSKSGGRSRNHCRGVATLPSDPDASDRLDRHRRGRATSIMSEPAFEPPR